MLPVDTAPGSAFNPKRKHPITGKVAPHTGQDFPCPVGTPVLAVLPWTFQATGFDPKREDGGTGAGLWLRLDHGLIDGHRITSRCYHLSKVRAGKGDTGHAGAEVALSGNTGDSTGPHLHFEIRVDGTPVDPMAWLSAHAPTPEEDTMLMLARLETSPDVFVGDGVTRRHVATAEDLADLQYRIRTGALRGDPEVHAVSRIGWLGALVGTTDAPVTIAQPSLERIDEIVAARVEFALKWLRDELPKHLPAGSGITHEQLHVALEAAAATLRPA